MKRHLAHELYHSAAVTYLPAKLSLHPIEWTAASTLAIDHLTSVQVSDSPTHLDLCETNV